MLGERIKKARKENGLTLKQLGEKIGRSHSALSQIESGAKQAEKITLISLAKTLNNNFGEDWLDEHLEGNQSFPNKREIIETATVEEIFTLKFGGGNATRSKAEMTKLKNRLDAELAKMKDEEERYGK